MKCKRCDYPLWTIKDRRCPECGLDFVPSQFKFVPRSVRFCCPHCDQHYFGTGVDGHLVPQVFDCVKCGQHLHMDEMVLTPADGLDAEQTTAEVMPWLDQDRPSFMSRWFGTMRGSLFGPTRLIERTPLRSSVGRAIWFMVFTSLVSVLLSAGIFAAIAAVMSTFSRTGGGIGFLFFGLGTMLVSGLAAVMVGWVVWLLATHLLLVITGGTAGGLRRTTHCMAYSSGPYILYAIPCLSFYLSPVVVIWQAISAAIMISRSQKVSGGRAAFATLFPVFLVVAGFAVFISLVVIPSFRSSMSLAMSSVARANASIQTTRAQVLCNSLINLARSNGAYPAHSAELLEAGVTANDFSLSTSPLAADTFPIGSTMLGRLEMLTPQRRSEAILAASRSQPPGIIAHRLGDYVFTYHGIDPATADPGLWVFIADLPPPTSLTALPPGARTPPTTVLPDYFVGTAGGQIQPYFKSGFGQALADQNELRATFNLPAIPNPAAIKHGSPAIAPK